MGNKKLNLDKNILTDLYINQKMTSNEIANILNCSTKSVRNYLKLYSIPIRENAEAVKLERSKWSDDKERARSLKFINTWNSKSEEERKDIIKRRTTSPNINSPQSIQKARETKLNNNTYIKSKAEDNFYNSLLLYFDKSDIVRGFIDKKRYPYNCDFYIKSKDLFIEYQGHQTHGFAPFDLENMEHKDYLSYMIMKGVDMTTWTQRDVNKLNCARHNRIKLLLIYPKNNSYFVKNGQINNIGKFNIVNINDID